MRDSTHACTLAEHASFRTGPAPRVPIEDDSPAVGRALQSMLAAELGIEVVGCASDRAGAVAPLDVLRPEVVTLDVVLAGVDGGYDVLRRIRASHEGVAVIVLSNFGWSSMRSAFIDAGAAAYFDKALEFRRAIDWLRRRAQGS